MIKIVAFILWLFHLKDGVGHRMSRKEIIELFNEFTQEESKEDF